MKLSYAARNYPQFQMMSRIPLSIPRLVYFLEKISFFFNQRENSYFKKPHVVTEYLWLFIVPEIL